MTREIKFRVWSVVNNRWAVSSEVTEAIIINPSYNGGKFQLDESLGNGLASDLGNKYNVMQYTGLKDKNDKDIYEGDIVTTTYGKYELEPNGLTRSGTVIYDIETARFAISIKNSAVKVSFYDVNKIEIIGNIYENPELLKEETK